VSLLAQTRKSEPGFGGRPVAGCRCDTAGVIDRTVRLERIISARAALESRVKRTPILGSTTAASILAGAGGPRLGDDRLYLKAEHLQKTGSFKIRGTLTKIATLGPAERAAGVITLSAGNAAQAYAWAAREAGIRATVVMPAAAVRSKVEACLGYGAEVVLHGDDVGAAWERVQELVRERGLVYCHPFDDPDVIAGHGSAGLEILEDLPAVDVVVVGVGGGGLISGVAAALKESRPSVRVYGVEPERSNAMSLALAARAVVPIAPSSVADGLGAPFAGEWTLRMVQRYVDGMVLLDDPTILAGVRFAAERMKQVLEPAGAAALAAVLFGRIDISSGERVCVVASGGNVEMGRLGELLAAAAPLPTAVVAAT
jgi:threonine dehydratase